MKRSGRNPIGRWMVAALAGIALGCAATVTPAARKPVPTDNSAPDLSRQQVIAETLHPYTGRSVRGVDPTTLHGKVLCGYQGWFSVPGDGVGRGWYHWTMSGDFKPGNAKVDLWPDVSELDKDERYPTPFRLADGRTAEVFSSFNRKTVLRHFKWMQDYGIDGVFVQRFITETLDTRGLRQFNTVLDHCREGANLYGRTYSVMYDLSGLGANQIDKVIDDWKLLVDRMHITSDPAYQHENGKPVVTLWGFGFDDHRKYTLDEGLRLVKFLHDDPRYGGCTVMLGIPAYWRQLKWDSVADPHLHDLCAAADILSPWTVGRYQTPQQADDFARTQVLPDLQWCRDHGKEYLPVVFPGFSWHNMVNKDPLNQIPRLKGRFLWQQYLNLKKAGVDMAYQAMFDEIDEGTAIFKCTNDVPVGASPFLTYEGLPSDFYLRLVGHASQMLRGQLPPSPDLPSRLATQPQK